MGAWTWAAAACRGTSHIKQNVRRQDAFSCVIYPCDEPVLIGVISDGAGSALLGGEGASLTCRTLISCAKAYMSRHVELPSDVVFQNWLNMLRFRIAQAAKGQEKSNRDFAATMVLVISTGKQTVIAHIGDGSVVLQDARTNEWFAASWPENGEYASTTYFVTDEPKPKLNVRRCDVSISAVALFSDGIERLALNMASAKPHQPFFDGIFKPFTGSCAIGRDDSLCRMLARFLDSDPINSRTDDDKSLILAVNR